MSEIARELSRRATPAYVTERAKETALNKTMQWQEQIFSSPTALGIIGGTIGALIGRSLAKERSSRSYGYEYRTAMYEPRMEQRYAPVLDTRGAPYTSFSDDRGGTADKLGGLRDQATDAVSNVRDRAGEAMANVRDRIPSTEQIGRTANENPMMVALGGLAMGVVAALLIPVSHKERQMLEPVKQRAGEAIGAIGDKLGDTVQQAQQKIEGNKPQEQQTGFDTSGASLTITH